MNKEKFIEICTDKEIDIIDRNVKIMKYFETAKVNIILNLIKDDDIFDFDNSTLEAIVSICLLHIENGADMAYYLRNRVITINNYLRFNNGDLNND